MTKATTKATTMTPMIRLPDPSHRRDRRRFPGSARISAVHRAVRGQRGSRIRTAGAAAELTAQRTHVDCRLVAATAGLLRRRRLVRALCNGNSGTETRLGLAARAVHDARCCPHRPAAARLVRRGQDRPAGAAARPRRGHRRTRGEPGADHGRRSPHPDRHRGVPVLLRLAPGPGGTDHRSASAPRLRRSAPHHRPHRGRARREHRGSWRATGRIRRRPARPPRERPRRQRPAGIGRGPHRPTPHRAALGVGRAAGTTTRPAGDPTRVHGRTDRRLAARDTQRGQPGTHYRAAGARRALPATVLGPSRRGELAARMPGGDGPHRRNPLHRAAAGAGITRAP